MVSKGQRRLVILGVLSVAGVLAQDAPLPAGSVSIKLPNDSPVALLEANTGESRKEARGAALVLDLHMSLSLRNNSPKWIHGITLRVVSQEVTLGGKASVAMPSLNVGPGDVFPVRIDSRLMRPTQFAAGTLVEVSLDGVLFQDLSCYGPDRLNSCRTMTAWEREAQRDREYFKRILAQSGQDGLKKAIVDSLARQADRPRLDVRVSPHGPAVTSAAIAAPEQSKKFALLEFPDSPIEPLDGWAMVSGNQARSPQVEVRNRSGKPVKYVELGWLVSDQTGQQYMAASLPAGEPGLFLPAGKTAKVMQDTILTFINKGGKPMNVQGMTGFVSQVEFADGKVWVPSRQNLDQGVLRRIVPPSNEEQRLTELYVKRGLPALVQELSRY
jgi:hypothetical protein